MGLSPTFRDDSLNILIAYKHARDELSNRTAAMSHYATVDYRTNPMSDVQRDSHPNKYARVKYDRKRFLCESRELSHCIVFVYCISKMADMYMSVIASLLKPGGYPTVP